MVLGQHHGEHFLSAHEAKEREFRSRHEFLDHNLIDRPFDVAQGPDRAELVVQQHVLQGRFGLPDVLGYHDTLASRQAIVFENYGKRTRGNIFKGIVVAFKSLVSGSRYVVLFHQLLGEVLAGLDGRSSFGRAKNGLPGLCEYIYDSCRQ